MGDIPRGNSGTWGGLRQYVVMYGCGYRFDSYSLHLLAGVKAFGLSCRRSPGQLQTIIDDSDYVVPTGYHQGRKGKAAYKETCYGN